MNEIHPAMVATTIDGIDAAFAVQFSFRST